MNYLKICNFNSTKNLTLLSLLIVLFVLLPTQPSFGATLLFDNVEPGLYTIRFRDISVIDNLIPSIDLPPLFPSEIGTMTVTDHNANVDLTTAETITVQINGLDTILIETDVNTGIFQGVFTAGDSVSYDPGVLGVARATINIDFDVDAGDLDGLGDIIIEDVILTDDQITGSEGFTPVTHPVSVSFDDGGKVKDGTNVIVTMSYADGDLRKADPNEGSSLAVFAINEFHEDSGATLGSFDLSETVYTDIDGDGTVSIGDVRLANAATWGYADGSVVASGDLDESLILAGFTLDGMHEDSGATLGTFDIGETIYKDVDGDGTVSIGDVRLANAATWGYADGSVVASGDFDEGLTLIMLSTDELYADFGGPTPGSFDSIETIYKDLDVDGFVSIGDLRLANAATWGYVDGSVAGTDIDVGTPLSLFAINEFHEDSGATPGSFDFGETVYTDIDGDGTVSIGDIRLANSASVGFVDGSSVQSADEPSLLQMYYQEPGFGYNLITASFDSGSHDSSSKTIMSNPTFDTGFGPVFCCPTVEGNYILGYETGSGGGGGGGIAKSGFVVNALGFVKTLGGGTEGGGGNHGSPSVFGQSSFAILEGGQEGAGGILSDNNATTLEQTKTFNVGQKAILRFDLTEDEGIGNIDHLTLYTNIRDGQNRKNSDTFISYEARNSPTLSIHDPNGFFSQTKFDILQKDARHFVLKYELTFAKPMAKSDIILDSWNLQRWATTNKIPNAIEVVSSGIVQEQTTPAKTTFTEDITNDKVIPVWVKTNAKWWADGTLDNKNFISGIEYLVNEGIIKVSTTGTSKSPDISEIQPWIKSTAGWWADDKISEDEFVTAIEWLITNNIIQVAA